MAFYNHVPAPDGFRHCPRCQTVKPLADFEPSPKRACGISQSCHICLVTGREERADVRQIVEEAAARMLEIQFRQHHGNLDPTQVGRAVDAIDRRLLPLAGRGAATAGVRIYQ